MVIPTIFLARAESRPAAEAVRSSQDGVSGSTLAEQPADPVPGDVAAKRS